MILIRCKNLMSLIKNGEVQINALRHYVIVSSNYFLLLTAATARITPRATPNRAAKRTLISCGRRNVIVCAGYQKKGIVFLNTKPH